MALFRRKPPSPERDVAAALAARGVPGRATVVALRETGASRPGSARELELTLDVELPDGPPRRVVQRQYLSRFLRHGLAPGEPVRVLYDRDDPATLEVAGHARLRTEVVGGQIVVVEGRDVGAPRA